MHGIHRNWAYIGPRGRQGKRRLRRKGRRAHGGPQTLSDTPARGERRREGPQTAAARELMDGLAKGCVDGPCRMDWRAARARNAGASIGAGWLPAVQTGDEPLGVLVRPGR